MKPQKVTRKRASEYDIHIVIPFSAVTISNPRKIWANQWVCCGMRVSYTCTPVNALCMYMLYNLTPAHFQQKCPQTMLQEMNDQWRVNSMFEIKIYWELLLAYGSSKRPLVWILISIFCASYNRLLYVIGRWSSTTQLVSI
jgi:hypothetical protein